MKIHHFRANTFSVMTQELAQELILSTSNTWPGAPQRIAWLSFPLTSLVQGYLNTLFIPLHWGQDWTMFAFTNGKVLRGSSLCSAALAATLTSEELSPSWRAPCREPAVAVPPAPAPLALSPAPKGAHSPDHKQGPVNGPEFEVKLSLASPWWHSPGKRAWAGNRVTFWLLWLLLLEWPPRCDTEEPLNCSQP